MNFQYKGIIADFDGTLADKTYIIDSLISEHVSALVSHDVLFSIATGRPYEGVIEDACKSMSLVDPQIVSGGSKIVQPQTREVLFFRTMPDNVSEKLLGFLLGRDAEFGAERGFNVYTTGARPFGYGPGISFLDVKDLDARDVEKIVLYSLKKPDDLTDFTLLLDSLKDKLHVIRAHAPGRGEALDITAESASKHIAVLSVLSMTGLSRHEVIGVGDGANDFPLLTACGYKIAMGNAVQELKDIADWVAPEQGAGGFFAILEKYFPK